MQQKKFVWAFFLGILLSSSLFASLEECVKSAVRLSRRKVPLLTTLKKDSPVFDVSVGNQAYGPKDVSLYDKAHGNVDTKAAMSKYLLMKNEQDGHLDIFVPVRSFPTDRPLDIANLYYIISTFGTKGLGPKERFVHGMKRNPEAKRAIRIFPIATPLGTEMATPIEFINVAKEIAAEFEVPVAISREYANLFFSRPIEWETFVPSASKLPKPPLFIGL